MLTEKNKGKVIALIENTYWLAEDFGAVAEVPAVEVDTLESAQNWLTSMDISLAKGLIKIKELTVDILRGENIVTSDVTADKFEIIDAATGEPYCITVVGDTNTSTPPVVGRVLPWNKIKGVCNP